MSSYFASSSLKQVWNALFEKQEIPMRCFCFSCVSILLFSYQSISLILTMSRFHVGFKYIIQLAVGVKTVHVIELTMSNTPKQVPSTNNTIVYTNSNVSAQHYISYSNNLWRSLATYGLQQDTLQMRVFVSLPIQHFVQEICFAVVALVYDKKQTTLKLRLNTFGYDLHSHIKWIRFIMNQCDDLWYIDRWHEYIS